LRMKRERLPAPSKLYSERAFVEKKMWHRRRARMSLEKKLQVLDRLLESRNSLPPESLADAQSFTQLLAVRRYCKDGSRGGVQMLNPTGIY